MVVIGADTLENCCDRLTINSKGTAGEPGQYVRKYFGSYSKRDDHYQQNHISKKPLGFLLLEKDYGWMVRISINI